jgi:hypothetical protein
MRVVLTADTHVPKRARDLPPTLWAAIDTADVVVHAGDWVDVSLLDAIEARAARLVAVYGNNDGRALRARLPEVARVELAGVRVAVVHETGAAAGREARCERRSRLRPARLRAQPHPVGHGGAGRPPAAQPRLTDRPPPATARDLHDRRDCRRARVRGDPAYAAPRLDLGGNRCHNHTLPPRSRRAGVSGRGDPAQSRPARRAWTARWSSRIASPVRRAALQRRSVDGVRPGTTGASGSAEGPPAGVSYTRSTTYPRSSPERLRARCRRRSSARTIGRRNAVDDTLAQPPLQGRLRQLTAGNPQVHGTVHVADLLVRHAYERRVRAGVQPAGQLRDHPGRAGRGGPAMRTAMPRWVSAATRRSAREATTPRCRSWTRRSRGCQTASA